VVKGREARIQPGAKVSLPVALVVDGAKSPPMPGALAKVR